MNDKDVDNAAFCYSANLLRMLLAMKLINEDEYNRIIEINADYYDVDLYYV